jgi:hypothetical protein
MHFCAIQAQLKAGMLKHVEARYQEFREAA